MQLFTIFFHRLSTVKGRFNYIHVQLEELLGNYLLNPGQQRTMYFEIVTLSLSTRLGVEKQKEMKNLLLLCFQCIVIHCIKYVADL